MLTDTDRSPIKAPPLREPGQSIREMTLDLVLGRLLPSLWLVSVLWVLLVNALVVEVLGWRVPLPVYVAAAAVGAIVCALQFHLARKRLLALELGRDGERVVARFLDDSLLPLGARVLHDVPADGFNLDHVVVARQGVFVIETKTRTKPRHRDPRVTFTDTELRIAGYTPDRNPLAQVMASGRWLAELLRESPGGPVRVRGVVVFPGWIVEPMTREWLNTGRPWVMEPKSLPGFLKREPEVLTERDVAELAKLLSRYVRRRQELARRS